MRDYYNTNRLSGDELGSAISAAQSQQDMILAHFRNHPFKKFAPHEVLNILFNERTPITSIRRAITNLEKDGHLIKTNHRIKGEYGAPVHTWRLSNGNNDQLKLF